MAEYIEREALMQRMGKFFSPVNTVEQALMLNHTLKLINLFPAADVAPVVHGRWMWDDDRNGYFCSECNRDASGECRQCAALLSDYCPNCGAKMDLED